MKIVCFGAVVFLGGAVAVLALYLSTVENCDRLTKGLGRGLGSEGWSGLLSFARSGDVAASAFDGCRTCCQGWGWR
jgi:hypothetical protein